MRRSILLLLLVTGRSAYCGTFPKVEHARHTYGQLGGPRDILCDGTYLYWVCKGRLKIARKDAVVGYVPKPAPAPTKENPKPKAPPFEPLSQVELRHEVKAEKGGKETTALRGAADRLCFASADLLCASTGLHLRLVDVKDRTRPKAVHDLRVADNEYLGVASIRPGGQGTVWAACRRQGLLKVRIDGEEMTIASVTPVNGWASDVALKGQRAFVATGRGIDVIDISATTPKPVASLDTERHAECLAVSGNILFFASKHYLVAVDISEPASPKALTEIGAVDPFFYSGALSLQFRGNHILCAHAEGGVYVWSFDRVRSQLRLVLQTSYWGKARRYPDKKKIAELKKEQVERYTSYGLSKKYADKFASWKSTSYVIAMGLAVDADHLYVNDLWGNNVFVYRYDLEEPSARLINWTN